MPRIPLSDLRLPAWATPARGLAAILLTAVLRDLCRTGWLTLFVLLSAGSFSVLTDPDQLVQIVRYFVPALVVLFILVFTRVLPRWRILSAGFALWTLSSTAHFLHWAGGQPVSDTYVGLGQRMVPRILAATAGEDDLVGSFDSGSVGYFSPVPVVNLDGLVNAEIVTLLRATKGGSWTARYRCYLAGKGITILVGGRAFSWVDIFPDLDRWEVLHPSLASSDGREIVFLRVPES